MTARVGPWVVCGALIPSERRGDILRESVGCGGFTLRERRLLVLVIGLAILAALASASADVAPAPVPVGIPVEGPGGLTVPNGKLARVGEGPDAIDVLYLWGTPYQMGYAHGRLLGDKIRKFYASTILAMSIGMKQPVEKLDEAWTKMEPFVSYDLKSEMRGLADGAGVSLQMVHRAHVIPDVSEFHCTFFGAWGKATTTGHLIQIRALDYATEASIQNARAIIVYKPKGKVPFVVVGWAGMIGCLSGISGQGIAVSEIGDNFGDEKETLAGEPMPFLLREVLERAHNVDEGTMIVQKAHRTSSFLYCIGDGKAPDARSMMTCHDFAYVFDPHSQPHRQLDDVVYFSMGADSPWNEKVYDVLKAKYGKIDENVAMQDVMKGLKTGSLHAVAWDVTDLKMWVANCTAAGIGTKGNPGYDQTFVPFDVGVALGLRQAR
jgi:hypothetical protein